MIDVTPEQRTESDNTFFQIRLETLAAAPAFDELLLLAAETCLADPEAITRYLLEQPQEAPTSEQEVVRRCGNWGLRAALDIKQNPYCFSGPDEDTTDSRLTASELICHPRSLFIERDPKIVDKIEGFGKALLGEAFYVLGEDAESKVKEFQTAETNGEKVAVIVWLVDRVIEIRDKNSPEIPEEDTPYSSDEVITLSDMEVSEEQDANGSQITVVLSSSPEGDRYRYHPIRLSPKVMGKYPDVQLSPTCLGVSILIASFFEKAGVPYFHAGVMKSAHESGRVSKLLSIDTIKEAGEKWGLELPDVVSDKLELFKRQETNLIDINRGHHAAVIARLGGNDDSWLLIDPNYHTITYPFKEESKELEDLYGLHKELHDITPGNESSIGFDEALMPTVFRRIIREVIETDVAVETLNELIDSALLEEEPLEIIKQYLMSMLTLWDETDTEDGDGLPIDYIFDEYMGRRYGYSWRQKEDLINDIMEHVILTYIFPDAKEGNIKPSLERCQTDTRYRQRRLEDLKFAPLYMLYNMQKDLVDVFADVTVMHESVELGLPHYRVGMSVLSDFAVYCGDELPPSFWLSYWPSHIVFSDHIAGRSLSEAQKALAWNLFDVMESGSLRYQNSHGIVNRFLEQEQGDAHGADSE